MHRRGLLRFLPGLTLALFLAPVIAGLIGTWLPAFGYFPSLGGDTFSLAPWTTLFAQPGLAESLRLTLISGFLATVSAFLLTVIFLAACHGGRLILAVRGLMAPLIAVPHAAVALGLAFLIAPSGWLVRLVSPWATGWDLPPDVATVQDANGLALTLGLIIKEVPFLLLMTLAALEQVRAEERLAVARSLGYGPVTAWLKAVLPAVYRQIRLPLYAVLAYALSVVDMALILAPLTPPPLAVQVLRWFNDPDLSMRFVAAAGACLQLLIVIAGIGLWRLGEVAAEGLGRAWIAGGRRGGDGRLPRLVAAGLVQGLVALAAAGLLGLALWSVTRRWRYPDAWPSSLSLDTWAHQAPSLLAITGTTLVTGLAAAAIALLLALGCLENEQRRGLTLSNRVLWLLYVPLLVPQVAFLFGAQVLAIQTGIDATWIALVWSHLLFVLPYVFLTLGDPYRALDERYARTALCLGARPNRVFWQVKLPMLLRPVLCALAGGFAVSVTQYLPTLFAGGGRFATLTTEAVGLSAGGDRRVMGVYAFLQALLPLLAFAAALALPKPLALRRKLRIQAA
ncbi:MAG: ABC transporter permease [Kiloniellaceae bacterium]